MWKTVLTLFFVALPLGVNGNARGQAEQNEPAGLDADPHLVGWWKLDDPSSKTAADSSKHARNGTLGTALRVDGGESRLEIVGYKGVSGTQPRTVAAWIKTKGSRGEIVAWGADDFGKMWTFGFVRGHVGVTPSGGYLYINERINDDQWHHVAAVVEKGDPPNLHDSVKLYVDGTLAEIHDIGLLDLWPIDTGNEVDVRVGRRFNGLIDDVRIYDRALSDEEIDTLFKQK